MCHPRGKLHRYAIAHLNPTSLNFHQKEEEQESQEQGQACLFPVVGPMGEELQYF
jgi:hypothetical protein